MRSSRSFTVCRSHTAPDTPPMETLKTNGQFERVRRAGRTWASGPVVLNAAPNGEDSTRCGFVAGKKVGNAVKRNHARRLMREAVRHRLPLVEPGWDLVWIARPSINEAAALDVFSAVDELLNRGRLYAPQVTETTPARSRIMYNENMSDGALAKKGAAGFDPETE